MIGKTFLRLERDFDKHVAYCRDEPNAQDFLAERDEVRNYFNVSTFQINIFQAIFSEIFKPIYISAIFMKTV